MAETLTSVVHQFDTEMTESQANLPNVPTGLDDDQGISTVVPASVYRNSASQGKPTGGQTDSLGTPQEKGTELLVGDTVDRDLSFMLGEKNKQPLDSADEHQHDRPSLHTPVDPDRIQQNISTEILLSTNEDPDDDPTT